MKFLDLNKLKVKVLGGRQASTPVVANPHADSGIDITIPPAANNNNVDPDLLDPPDTYRARRKDIAMLFLAFCLIILPALIAMYILASRLHQSNQIVNEQKDPDYQQITHL
ncbi:hypothetical protein BKA65DRAFT_473432 [Rhexocercosporidium sp. MPI-PUGE-AT-0058]|nr:hypothetical protein BKA65DRAFT_473432 [Rhexocercosporidium sp. MPI-PUGE-AT-0058]